MQKTKKQIKEMSTAEIVAEFFTRPDLQADMVQAAVDVAQAQGFVPANEPQHFRWMHENEGKIQARFKQIQEDRLANYVKHEAEIKRVLAYQVWREIRVRAGLPVDN